MFHFFFLFWVVLYFLPSIIGFQKHNAAAIILVNLLLGWTVVGWFVAFVWAITAAPAPGANWGPFSSWQTAGPWQQPQQPPYQAPQQSYQPPQQPYSPPQPQAPPAAQPQGGQQARAGFCSHCGSPLRMGDRYCQGCGSSVPQA